ncbi:MAG: sialate O-acetylesterase [Bacillus subtilis]|nr:sialate O-acetylesterase [Bacillus subtilis]
MIGEVWVASGQSNMGMSVREIDEGDVLMARAEQNAIRIFYQANGMDAGQFPFTPDYDVQNGNWKTADSGANIADCSAIGYTFAYELYYRFITDGKEVPIAILNTQKGGAMIQSYLPRQAMLDNSAVRNYVISRGYDFLESAYNTKGSNNYQQPSALYNRKVAPLMNFNINGVIWYQGESDANYASNLQTLPMLMETWSQGFNKNDELLPFVFIQLAPFDGADYDLGPSTQLYTYHAFAEHRLAQPRRRANEPLSKQRDLDSHLRRQFEMECTGVAVRLSKPDSPGNEENHRRTRWQSRVYPVL